MYYIYVLLLLELQRTIILISLGFGFSFPGPLLNGSTETEQEVAYSAWLGVFGLGAGLPKALGRTKERTAIRLISLHGFENHMK